MSRWILGALFAVTAVLAGLTLHGLSGSRDNARPESSAGAASTGAASSAPAMPGQAGTETPPWQASPQNTTALPPGTVPAWQVNAPPPDPAQPLPPPPREPPNPAVHRPPMDNPGGVNGDRPERPVPGVE
jgi:hypothetical protein